MKQAPARLRRLLAASSRPGAAERFTLRVACALAIGLAACAVLLQADPRQLDNGEGVWLKPLRFCLAFGVHLVTMVWIGRLGGVLEQPNPAYAWGLWLQTWTVVAEMMCIGFQAARGVHSHFNYTSPLDHAVFTVMGLGTAVTLLGLILCAWGLWTSALARFDQRMFLAAMGLAVLGGLVGVLMVIPTREQRTLLDAGQQLAWIGGVGVGEPSGRQLPFFSWDLAAGDWRAAHFAGLHALQALPLLVWLSRQVLAVEKAQTVAMISAVAYGLGCLAVIGWTASGHSVLAVSQPGWVLIAIPSAVFSAGLAWLGWLAWNRSD